MTEVIRYSRIGKQDIRFGRGTFETELADGRKVVLDEVDLGTIILDSSLSSGIVIDPTLSDPITLTGAAGIAGRRLSIEASGNGGAEVQLLPGPDLVSSAGCAGEILIFNKVGTDYERFGWQCVNDQFILDSTYNNSGTARNIYIQMGGRTDPSPISGRNAITCYGDASVDIHASTYSADGKTWGATFARFTDPGDAGSTRVLLDTRSTTPASNVADSAYISYRRGGANKWHAGLNVSGLNADTFDIYGNGGAWVSFYELNGGPVIELSAECSGDPSAPVSNRVRLYLKDNGSGKTQLMALFASGVAQQLAIQP